MKRHEIPTHLNVEDKAFYGLSARQAMLMIAGLSLSYGVWNQTPAVAEPLRITLALACGLVALTVALVRPHGRGLEEWAFVLVHYLALPKDTTWCPREPEPPAAQVHMDDWEEFAPRLAWPEVRR